MTTLKRACTVVSSSLYIIIDLKVMKEYFEDLYQPNESSLGSVSQMPSVGGEILPADVLGVVPQSADLKQMRCRS